jgi:hypothetical protein
VSYLTILGGNVDASAVNGSGIGSGATLGPDASTSVSTVLLLNGSFTVRSSLSGVGHGASRDGVSSVDNVTILGGVFDCSALDSAMCFDADFVAFATGSTIVLTGSTTVGSPGWNVSGFPELYCEYLVSSLEEETTDIALLHLSSVSLPGRGLHRFRISQVEGPNPEFERVIEFNNSRSQDCAFSVPSLGQYQISFNAVSGSASGLLGYNGVANFSVSRIADNFYCPVTVIVDGTTGATSDSTSSPEVSDEPSSASEAIVTWPPIVEIHEESKPVRYIMLLFAVLGAIALAVDAMRDVAIALAEEDSEPVEDSTPRHGPE